MNKVCFFSNEEPVKVDGEQHNRHLTHCIHLPRAAQYLDEHQSRTLPLFSTHLMSKVVGLSDCREHQRSEESGSHLVSNLTFCHFSRLKDFKSDFWSFYRLANLDHWMFHWPSKYVADPDEINTFSQIFHLDSRPVYIVAHSRNESGKVGEVFPIRVAHLF